MSGGRNVVGRAADERVLDWIKRRARGQSLAAIAAECGAKKQQVGEQTNAVRQADVLCSRRDCTEGLTLQEAYW